MELSNDERLNIVHSSINWLRENPDKHITTVMARDKNGFSIYPTSETATCFCVLGRIAHEAGLGKPNVDNPFNDVDVFLMPLHVESWDVWNTNDDVNVPLNTRLDTIEKLFSNAEV